MAEPFTIRYDPGANRIEFKFMGIWDEAANTQWSTCYQAILRGARPGFTTLADMRDYPLQAPEVQATHEDLIEMTIQHGLRKGVIVVSETIMEMQMKRVAGKAGNQDKMLCFASSVEDARRILDE